MLQSMGLQRVMLQSMGLQKLSDWTTILTIAVLRDVRSFSKEGITDSEAVHTKGSRKDTRRGSMFL